MGMTLQSLRGLKQLVQGHTVSLGTPRVRTRPPEPVFPHCATPKDLMPSS